LAIQQRSFTASQGNAGPFVWVLIETHPTVGEALCRQVVETPDSALREVLPVALSQVATLRPEVALGLAHDLLATENLEVVRAAAQAFGVNRGRRTELLEDEVELLHAFARHEDPWVRKTTVWAARSLLELDRVQGITLLAAVQF